MKLVFNVLALLFFSSLNGQGVLLDSLYSMVDTVSDPILKGDIYIDIADEEMGISLERSLSTIKKALAISESINNSENIGRSLSWMGRVYGELKKLDSALIVLTRAEDIFSNPIDSFYLSKVFNAIGIIHRYNDDIDNAIKYQFQSAKFAEDTEQYQAAASSYNSLGNLYNDIGDDKRSVEYYEKSIVLLKKNNNTRSMVGAMLNLANVLDSFPDKKINYYREAKKIGLENGYNRELAYIYCGLADYYEVIEENVDSQRYYYQQAMEKAELANDVYITAYSKLYSGILESRDNPSAAVTLISEALANEYIGSDNELQVSGLNHLAKAYYSLGNYKGAYDNLDSAFTIFERLYNDDILVKMQEASAKFETEKKEAEILRQELELESQKRKQNQIIGGGILMLLLTSGIGLWYYQRQTNKKKLAELAYENEKKEKVKLEELDNLKTQFFTNVSHELKTPLTLIMGPLSNMVEKVDNLEVKRNLLLAYNNAEKLNDLINETLDLAKIEKGGIPIQNEERAIGKDLKRNFLSFDSLAEMRNIQLKEEISIPEAIVVDCDYGKIEKVVNNLISNAIKFSPNEAEVVLKASLEDDLLVIAVIDHGKGIPEEELDKIFNRFYQAKHNLHGNYGGTGVGLAYSKEISNILNGTLEVESEIGKGSTFVFKVPVVTISNPIVSSDNYIEETKLRTPYVPILINGEKPKILIVEDNKDMQEYLSSILEKEYRCDTAVDGYEAIKKVQTSQYHLISSDVMMPNMDGFSLKDKINGMSDYKSVPFIFLTARSLDEDKLIGLRLGVDDYITKPFNKSEYQTRIHNLLQNHKERTIALTELESNHDTEPVDIQILKAAEQSIFSNLSNPMYKVTDLADELHYSQRQLARIIKQLTGYTPVAFVLELRLQKAHQLLMSKQYGSVNEVRDEVGIESASYFTRKFKERFGLGPSEV